MTTEIELGEYRCSQENFNGSLLMILNLVFVGSIPYSSIHYKIILDGTKEEILVHEQNDCFIDGKNRQWTKI